MIQEVLIKYCRRCVLPDTKPDFFIDDAGICSACRAFELRDAVDWDRRKAQLQEIADKAVGLSPSGYDCIIPVSGGKDSFYQTRLAQQLGLNPLCVNSRTCDLTPIGRRNLENLRELGVDLIEYSPNPLVRRKLNSIGLREVGDISWPEHVGIFTFPIHVAVKFRIPLIVWGENPQNEYGGPSVAQEATKLDTQWLTEFGGLLGLRVEDLQDVYGLDSRELLPYLYPSLEEIDDLNLEGIFLGQFVPWSGLANALTSQAFGWESWPLRVEGSYLDYENLDNYQTGVHDYFKFLKFGFGRASDQISMHIRRGLIDRKTALSIIAEIEGKIPSTYLGKSLSDILNPLGVSLDEFHNICDKFTNPHLFEKTEDGFARDSRGNLLRVYDPH